MKKSDLLVSIQMYKDGTVKGLLGAEFGASKSIARDLLGIMFPSVQIREWRKVDSGWEFVGSMVQLKVPPVTESRSEALVKPKRSRV